MYEKLEDNLNSTKINKQTDPNNNTFQIDTMNIQIENNATNHQHEPCILAESLNQSFQQQQKKRINSCVRNQHNRMSKDSSTMAWLRSFSLFKMKHKQQHQQQQQQQQTPQRQLRKKQSWLLLTTIIVLLTIIDNSMSPAEADENVHNNKNDYDNDNFNVTAIKKALKTFHNSNSSSSSSSSNSSSRGSSSSSSINYTHTPTTTFAPFMASNSTNTTSARRMQKKFKDSYNREEDSIFLRFTKRFLADNNLWSGLIQDCYARPTFSCFQKNVYYYLNDVLDARDVNITQRFKLYKNDNSYRDNVEEAEAESAPSTQSSLALDSIENSAAEDDRDVEENEIPYARKFTSFTGDPSVAETPIEEVTNALYDKSVKFAMTHDIEVKLPEMIFDGAIFRISPKSLEGNGVLAKLELIPKQQSEARLAGKILMKKIQKFLKSKLLLSFLALVLIIKIIKIKLFWLLPLVIGVGAAKKLLLKFLLFLFPALSHLFKLCSYYQQTYHSTKYHHHHHHINHHHTVVPAWHSPESAHIPELIYTHPPKGHVSAYLHGAPIHESYGPPSHEHFETGWANSGPGLGSEFISDINRVAHVDDKTNLFKPHPSNDAYELHGWGLGTTPISNLAQNKKRLQHQPNTNQIQKPPINQAQQPLNYQKPQATSHTFNPFVQPGDKQSFFNSKHRSSVAAAQSAPSPVYAPARQNQLKPQLQAAQIAAQYDPTRNQQQQPSASQPLQTQTQLSPELSAQLKEAIRIQAEQRLVQQQQQILDKQPFVQDGQPLMPLNYDPFYSPILLKVDKIVEQLGVSDDSCKERLVCSMYKDPQRYSPHSNFVSAELSRDTNELQAVKSANQAVIRFFRLIQAARDGQDQKDCLALYPNCSINTE